MATEQLQAMGETLKEGAIQAKEGVTAAVEESADTADLLLHPGIRERLHEQEVEHHRELEHEAAVAKEAAWQSTDLPAIAEATTAAIREAAGESVVAAEGVVNVISDKTEIAKDKAVAAVHEAEHKGEEAVEWAKEKGIEAVEIAKEKGAVAMEAAKETGEVAKEKGIEAVEFAKEKGAEATEWAKSQGRASLEMAKEKGAEIVDMFKEKGSEALTIGKEKGAEATEWAKSQGRASLEIAKEKGAEIVDMAKEKGSVAVTIAKEKGAEATEWAKSQGRASLEIAKEKGAEATEWAKSTGRASLEMAKEKGEAAVQTVKENIPAPIAVGATSVGAGMSAVGHVVAESAHAVGESVQRSRATMDSLTAHERKEAAKAALEHHAARKEHAQAKASSLETSGIHDLADTVRDRSTAVKETVAAGATHLLATTETVASRANFSIAFTFNRTKNAIRKFGEKCSAAFNTSLRASLQVATGFRMSSRARLESLGYSIKNSAVFLKDKTSAGVTLVGSTITHIPFAVRTSMSSVYHAAAAVGDSALITREKLAARAGQEAAIDFTRNPTDRFNAASDALSHSLKERELKALQTSHIQASGLPVMKEKITATTERISETTNQVSHQMRELITPSQQA